MIQEIGTFENDWRIVKMDLTPRNDIIVAVRETDVAASIIENGRIEVKALKGDITLPTGPVVEDGEVNYKRYSLRLNPPLDMSVEEIEQYLNSVDASVREIIWETKGGTGIPCGGIQIYAKFKSAEAAHSFPRKHNINGKRVFIRHIGLLKCDKCGKNGHHEDRCEKIGRAIARNRRRKEM